MSGEFRGYALLMGVGECEDRRRSLPVTVQDAEALKGVLVDPGLCGYGAEQVRLLSNESATRLGILAGLVFHLMKHLGRAAMTCPNGNKLYAMTTNSRAGLCRLITVARLVLDLEDKPHNLDIREDSW